MKKYKLTNILNEIRISDIVSIINKSKKTINNELGSTSNSWIACYKGQLDAIETYLNLNSVKEILHKDINK